MANTRTNFLCLWQKSTCHKQAVVRGLCRRHYDMLRFDARQERAALRGVRAFPDVDVRPWEANAACAGQKGFDALPVEDQRQTCVTCRVRRECAALGLAVAREFKVPRKMGGLPVYGGVPLPDLPTYVGRAA